MKNLFRLRYKNSQNVINLDKEENQIKGGSLRSLEYHVDDKLIEDIHFTIIKYEFEGILNWKIINNTKHKDIYLNSRSNPTKQTEIKITPGEIYRLKVLLDEKLYFNSNNQNWDFFYFDRIKVEDNSDTLEIISRKIENEPLEIDYEELNDLFKSQDDDICSTPEKSPKNFSDKLMESENVLNICRIEDEEEEIQRSSIFKNEKYLDELLLEYNFQDKGGNKKIKELISANNNELTKKNPGINVHNIQSIPLKQIQISKNKKIITDDEEDNQLNSAENTGTNQNLKNKTEILCSNPFKKQNNYDDILTESALNEILQEYNEPAKNKENSVEVENTHQETQFNKDRQNLINKGIKQGAEFNSNHKRLLPSSYLKEIDNHFSAFKTKRLKKATENKELKIDTNTTCAICLENISCLANLDNCTHDFCKPCIIEWSTKYANVCPLCKKDFKKIIYYEKNKKKEIKVKKKKFKLDEEEDFGLLESFVEESADNCMVCNSNSDFPNMLVCDGCHYNVCHTYCDGLNVIPYEDWFCTECRSAQRSNRRYRQHLIEDVDEEESDEDDDSYEPQIQLNVEPDDLDEYILKDCGDLYDEDSIEESENVSATSHGCSIEVTRKRGRPRKIDNNFNNLSVNISVNLNMTNSLRGRRPNKNQQIGEENRMTNNNNLNSNNNTIVNNNRNPRNLNNITINSNYSSNIINQLSNDNTLNLNRSNLSSRTISRENLRRGRSKNR
jgi:hypothetical protein